MKLLTKVLIGGAVLLAGTVGAICLAKKHNNNNEDEYVEIDVETNEDSDLEEEAE